jgi:molybdopterin molybdotransferase
MISVAEARARILGALRPVGVETVGLAEAAGRVLAAPVRARLSQPPARLSAMDGYAVRAAEAAVGALLTVAGESAAGHPFGGVLPPGGAIRVSTGSVVPDGADSVIIQEDVDRAGGEIAPREAARAGRHIRPEGQDFRAGDTLLEPGRRLAARHVGLIAAADQPWVTVYRRPRVALLATGDELSLPGQGRGPAGVVASNAHALAALLRAACAAPQILPVAADTREAIAASLSASAGCDLLVTIGGASVGDHDLVRQTLGAHGLALDFWKIAMRPGKPLIHGHLGPTPLLGLPGNPVSAYVCAVVFLLPAVAALGGRIPAEDRLEPALLTAPLRGNDQRQEYIRAALGSGADGAATATPFPDQASSLQRILAESDALIVRPPDAPPAPAGATVPVLRLDRLDP